MKRTSRVFALFLSAIFALSMVPVQALAAAGSGQMYDEDAQASGLGKITIENTMSTEEYDLYRIFDLASFNDSETVSGNHDNEAYTYVIRKNIDDNNTVENPWYTFLTTKKLVENSGDTYMAVEKTPQATVSSGQLFWIDSAPITLKDPYGVIRSDYYVITPTENFPSNWDVSTSASTSTYKYDEQDYANPMLGKESVKTAQAFAQLALAYAREEVDAGSGAKKQRIQPNYKETGNGTIDQSGSVVVNGTNTLQAGLDKGRPQNEKVYLGWYLMGTSMGTLASLDTTNTDVHIYEKSEKPDLKKRVLNKREYLADAGHRNQALLNFTVDQLEDTEPTSHMWVKDTDADLSDYVLFKTVITTQQGAGGYVLHDVMEDGLQFVDNAAATDATNQYQDSALYNSASNTYDYSVKIYHIDYEPDASGLPARQEVIEIKRTVGQDNNFFVRTKDTSPQVQSDGCDFEVVFNDTQTGDFEFTYEMETGGKKNVSDKDKIVVLYWAKVTNDAALWQGEATGTNDASKITPNNSATPLDATHQIEHTTHNGNGRNDNYTILTYGAGSHTKVDKASVTTYQFDVVKTDANANNGGSYNLLKGAKFSVYKANNISGSGGDKDPALSGSNAKQFSVGGSGTGSTVYHATGGPLAFYATTDGNNNAYYRFAGDSATASTANATTLLTSSDLYEMSLRGLEAGTYLIFEESAPKGFNKLAYPIVVTIVGDNDCDGTSSGDQGYVPGEDANEGTLNYIAKKNSEAETAAPVDASQGTTGWDATKSLVAGQTTATYTPGSNNGGIQIVNQSGRELPSTGGLGTKMIYTMGVVLLGGAAVLFVTKRRMGAEV